MPLDPVGVLHSGVFMAVVAWLYGWLVGLLWTPFLLSGRLRSIFTQWSGHRLVNYVLGIPVPAAIWGFLFGCGLSLSGDLRGPTEAASLYVGGIDGIVLATVVSLLLWPTVLLYVLPDRGLDWADGDYGLRTGLLTVAGTVWYLAFLVGPAYALTVFAGFGQVLSHSG